MLKFRDMDNLDLIKIYQEGNFEDFVDEFLDYEIELKKFDMIYEEVIDIYFPEIKEIKLTRGNGIYQVRSELRENLNEDIRVKYIKDNYDKFYCNKYISHAAFIVRKVIIDPIGKEFINNYYACSSKKIPYINVEEDLIKEGYFLLADFVHNHPICEHQRYLEAFREKLTQIRIETNLSVEDFASEIGISKRDVCLAEGKIDPLRCGFLTKYAKYQGISLKELIEYPHLIRWFKRFRYLKITNQKPLQN